MEIHKLSPAHNSTTKRKRVGRGIGSGFGKTSTRGQKGQKSRSGGKIRRGFEGGQTPIYRRIPKRGFNNIFSLDYAIVNVSDLEVFDNDTTVNIDTLLKEGIIKKELCGLKILGNGKLTKRLVVEAKKFSTSAKEKIEAAGGKIEVK